MHMLIELVLLVVGFVMLIKGADIFVEGAPIITEIKDIIVAYLLKKSDRTEELPELFTNILQCMKCGFELLT